MRFEYDSSHFARRLCWDSMRFYLWIMGLDLGSTGVDFGRLGEKTSGDCDEVCNSSIEFEAHLRNRFVKRRSWKRCQSKVNCQNTCVLAKHFDQDSSPHPQLTTFFFPLDQKYERSATQNNFINHIFWDRARMQRKLARALWFGSSCSQAWSPEEKRSVNTF